MQNVDSKMSHISFVSTLYTISSKRDFLLLSLWCFQWLLCSYVMSGLFNIILCGQSVQIHSCINEFLFIFQLSVELTSLLRMFDLRYCYLRIELFLLSFERNIPIINIIIIIISLFMININSFYCETWNLTQDQQRQC